MYDTDKLLPMQFHISRLFCNSAEQKAHAGTIVSKETIWDESLWSQALNNRGIERG